MCSPYLLPAALPISYMLVSSLHLLLGFTTNLFSMLVAYIEVFVVEKPPEYVVAKIAVREREAELKEKQEDLDEWENGLDAGDILRADEKGSRFWANAPNG